MDALEKCHPAATMFVLKSRLFDAAPMHHGGLLKFLWAMFGPLAIKAKGKKFLKKVDAGGLSDVPDSFGLGRPLPAKKRGAVRKVKGPKNYPKPRALGAVRLRRAGRRAGEVAARPAPTRIFLFPPPTLLPLPLCVRCAPVLMCEHELTLHTSCRSGMSRSLLSE